MPTVFRKFSKLAVVCSLLTLSAAAQVQIRAGITGSSWTALTACPAGSYDVATPDNLHVFKAIQTGTGTTGATQPTWNLSSGSLTVDGTCTWMESGTSGLGGLNLAANYVFTGINQFTLGALFGPVFFANLSTPADGAWVYCIDCQATNPCLGLGTGAFAGRISGTWSCQGGGGGGGSVPGGSNTQVQINDNGVLYGNSGFTYQKATNTLTLPDGSTWAPAGITAPNNAYLKLEGNVGSAHVTGFQVASSAAQFAIYAGSLSPLNGGHLDLAAVGSAVGGYVNLGLYDGSGHYVGMQQNYQTAFDSLGFQSLAGRLRLGSESNDGFMYDRSTNTVHLYTPLVLPNGAGTSYSYGVSGAVPVSQGIGTPVKWSSDLTGPYQVVGAFGTCSAPGVNKSALCFGPAGHIQGSWNNDTFHDFVRDNNIPAAGITGLVEPSQIDLTVPTGLGGLFVGINAVSQYCVPGWGASGVGPSTCPLNDAADAVVSAAEPVNLASNGLGPGVTNCSVTGTTINKLAKLSSSAGASCAVIASIADTQGEIGVVTARSGTTGAALVAKTGLVSLDMDGATTANDWVINSPSVAGDGRDTGSTTCPVTGSQVIGRVQSTNAASGTYKVLLGGCDTTGGGGGGGGLADPGSNGILSRTALNTTAARTLTAGSANISITNGDGVAGNPTIDVGASVTTSSNTQTFTNKTYDSAGTGNVFKLNGTQVTTKNDIANVNTLTDTTCTGAGTAQAQTATCSPVTASLATGLVEWFLPAAANTGAAPTYAPDGLLAKNITKCGNQALVANDLDTTTVAQVYYDGTQWELLNPQAGTCSVFSGSYAVNAVRVTSDFTTTSATLVAITGLSWTLPANVAANYRFDCTIMYNEATSATNVAFGIQDVTTAPTNINANMLQQTNTSTFSGGSILNLSTTTATAFTAFAPAVTFNVSQRIQGVIEQPSGAASVFQIMADIASGITLTVKRGSSCTLEQTAN